MQHAQSLFQLGIDLGSQPSASKTEEKTSKEAQKTEQTALAVVEADERKDFFIERVSTSRSTWTRTASP